MKFLGLFMLLPALLVGCTEGQPEFSEADSSIMPRVLFSETGTDRASMSVYSMSDSLTISGECHTKTKSLEWAIADGNYQALDLQNAPGSDVDCSDGQFSIVIADISTLMTLSIGDTKAVKMRSIYGVGTSLHSQMDVTLSNPVLNTEISLYSMNSSYEAGTLIPVTIDIVDSDTSLKVASGPDLSASLTLEVYNSNDTLLSVHNSTASNGTAYFVSASIDPAGSGYYVKVFKPDSSHINGGSVASLATSPIFAITPAAASAADSSIAISGSPIVKGDNFSAVVSVADAYGNSITTGGDTVSCSVSGGLATVSTATVDNGDGTYSCSFTADAHGSETITTFINSNAGSSISLTISPLPVSKVIVYTATTTDISGTCFPLMIKTKNADNELVIIGSSETFALSDSSSNGSFYSDAACATALGSNSISFGSVASSEQVWYQNNVAETVTVTAAHTSLTDGTLNIITGPSQLVVAGAAKVRSADCSHYTVTSLDENGSAANLLASRVVNLSHDSHSSAEFYAAADSTCAGAAITNLSMLSGASSVSFYFKEPGHSATAINAADSVSELLDNSLSIQVGPQKVQILGGLGTSFYQHNCNPISIYTRDSQLGNSPVLAETTLNLASNSGSGQFYTSSTCNIAHVTTTVTIPSGSHFSTIYYQDDTPGLFNLSAAYSTGNLSLSMLSNTRTDGNMHPFCDQHTDKTSFNEIGTGTNLDPYLLCTNSQLVSLKDNCSGVASLACTSDYRLMTNLDMSGEFFTPIGSLTNIFLGKFDGNNHAIQNLSIADGSADQVGMFRVTGTGAIIENLELTSPNIIGRNKVGAFVGYHQGTIRNSRAVSGGLTGDSFVGGIAGHTYGVVAKIENSESSMYITVKTAGANNYFGGITGQLTYGTISNCNNTGSLSTSVADYVGGVVGKTLSSATVVQSSSIASITGFYNVGGAVGSLDGSSTIEKSTANGSVSGESYVGGLVGESIDSTINQSMSIGTVTTVGSSATVAGGLVGIVAGLSPAMVSDSYSKSSVSITSGGGSHIAGAFIGEVTNNFSVVDRCYATGIMSGQGGKSQSGFIGEDLSDLVTGSSYSYNYYDSETTGGSASDKEAANSIEGLTTLNMQTPATYSNWDSSTVWTLLGGSYPKLVNVLD